MTHFTNLNEHKYSSSTMWPKHLVYFHYRLHHAGLGWIGLKLKGFSEVLFFPASMLLLFIPPPPSTDCRAELGCICHRHYRESPMPVGLRSCGQFTGCEQLSQATSPKSTEHNPSQWGLSNLSSFMYELPGCPTAGGRETLVPPHRNLCGIIPSELFIVHKGDIF